MFLTTNHPRHMGSACTAGVRELAVQECCQQHVCGVQLYAAMHPAVRLCVRQAAECYCSTAEVLACSASSCGMAATADHHAACNLALLLPASQVLLDSRGCASNAHLLFLWCSMLCFSVARLPL